MSNPKPGSNEHYDAIIIGAGVIGSSIALEMSRRGVRTLNVDRAHAAGAGSTSSSSAVVRFSYSTRDGVAMSWEAAHYWKDWATHIGVEDELGLIKFHNPGQLLMAKEGEARIERVVALWDELGLPYERWTLDELEQKLPYLDAGLYGPPARPEDDVFWDDPKGTFAGAVFSPDAGYVSDPQLTCHNLQVGAEAEGAVFLFNAEVTSIDKAGGCVSGVTLADGRSIVAPVVVNVTGPHSSLINKMAGVYDSMNIKTSPLRHEVHYVPAPKDLDFMSRGVVGADEDLGFYFRPDTGNNILLGGVEADCDPYEVLDDPDVYDPKLSDEMWETQVLRANRRIPSIGGVPHQKRGIVDRYDVSDDWIPIYDRTDLDGFYVAIGTSGNQFKNAGAVGQVMADLIEAVEAGHDHDADPVQVTGRHTGLTIDLAYCSRNREIDKNSSMSVWG